MENKQTSFLNTQIKIFLTLITISVVITYCCFTMDNRNHKGLKHQRASVYEAINNN